ncbi:17810_t:CDS:2 [Funneliformis caledonium]|uniref:17810_t:CDS:1 n=1 Tax=Funneliformis caledonium TaxID=1117310 RepID=A0A9N9DMI5_9GLOM|nr:17810_t:CDS:2 [Funneliformis caledonium]
MASPEHEGLVMQLIYAFIIPNSGIHVNPPIDIALKSFHYDPSNVRTKIAPLDPEPPPGDVNLNPHARVIVEVAVTEYLDFLNRKCEKWLLQLYIRSVFRIKIYDKLKGTNNRTMKAKLWTRQILAPAESTPSTLASWDFGTLQFNSNQPTGCTGAGLPNYTVTIPVSDVFWDPPIVAGVLNLLGYTAGISNTVVANNFVIDLYLLQQIVLLKQ